MKKKKLLAFASALLVSLGLTAPAAMAQEAPAPSPTPADELIAGGSDVEGGVTLSKKAEPVDGTVNTWDITLRIEGKDTKKTSDVVLVIDRSGSMAWGQVDKQDGDPSRLDQAKDAANAFVDTVLEGSDTTRIGVVSFAGNVTTNQGLTTNATNLKDAINGLSAEGGTFTQAGIHRAQQLLANSTANNKHIVLLSDGEPTYSYLSDREGTYDYEFYVGTGRAMVEGGVNHGTDAINEAGFAKAAGTTVWTVATYAGTTGNEILKDIATPGNAYQANLDSLRSVFQEIAGAINSAVKDATVTDPMGVGFQVYGEPEDIVTSQGTATYNPETSTLSWDPGTLTEPVSEGSDVKYAELKYRVITNDLIGGATPNGELYPTNGDAQVTYTDAAGKQQNAKFPVPYVNPTLYTIEKKVLHANGDEYTEADENFIVTVSQSDDPTTVERIANPSQVVKTYGTLHWDETYTFTESHEGYKDPVITINGVPGNSLKVDDGNDDFAVVITNQLLPVDVTATKVWDGGADKDHGEVTFQLKQNGENLGDPVTTKDSYTWSDLDKTDTAGKPYIYTVEELDVPDGYTASVSDPVAGEVDGKATVALTVTNTYVIPKINVTAKKTWAGGAETDHGEVTLQLQRKVAGGKFQNVGDPVKTTESYTWENVDKTTKAAEPYEYTVVETSTHKNYTAKVEPIAEDGTINVTNTYASPKISVTAKKEWVNGAEADHSEVELQLQRNGKDFGDSVTTKDLTYTWPDLDKTDADGAEYKYTVVEVTKTENYGVTYSEDGLTVTNTYKIPTMDLTASKTWVDGAEDDHGEVTLQLQRDGKDFGEAKTTEELKATWTGLDVTDEKGNKYTYSVVEQNVPKNYTPSYGKAEDGSLTVTNTYASPKYTEVKATKVWDGGKAEDHKDVALQLLQNGEKYGKPVTTVDGVATWTDVPQTNSMGVAYDYTVEEPTVPTNYAAVVTGGVTDGFIVTNTYTSPKIEISAMKEWKGGAESGEVSLQLLRDGEPFGEPMMTSDHAYKWTGLDATDKDGVEYKYTVQEVTATENYGVSYSEDGLTVTNTFMSPKADPIAVTKVWDDGDDADKMRPESVTVTLVADGEATDMTLVLSAENQWMGAFEGLDKLAFEDGHEIVYTVEEAGVEGYTAEVTGSAAEGFTITNSHTPKPPAPKPVQPPAPQLKDTGSTIIALPIAAMALLGAGAFLVAARRRED